MDLKQIQEDKIVDSKGNIYESCRFIDELLDLIKSQKEILDKMSPELEKVRKINAALRERGNEDTIEELKEEERNKVWDDVGDILGHGYYNFDERDLKKYAEEKEDIEADLKTQIEDLEERNSDLLREIEDLKNE